MGACRRWGQERPPATTRLRLLTIVSRDCCEDGDHRVSAFHGDCFNRGRYFNCFVASSGQFRTAVNSPRLAPWTFGTRSDFRIPALAFHACIQALARRCDVREMDCCTPRLARSVTGGCADLRVGKQSSLCPKMFIAIRPEPLRTSTRTNVSARVTGSAVRCVLFCCECPGARCEV